jgi:Tol biopolymer transport system component
MTRNVTPARTSGAVRNDDWTPSPTFLAPALSVIGLVIVALLTVGLFTGQLPIPGQSNGTGPVPPNATAAPSNIINTVTFPPAANPSAPPPSVPGSIVFAKAGNIWVDTNFKAKQITNTGQDSMPSWSPDGQWIYFIQTVDTRGLFPQQGNGGGARYYTLTYPILTRVHPDGTGRQAVFSGLYKAGGGAYQWFFWIRQPVMGPDGHTIALVSDGPDPTRSDVVLQFYDTKTNKMTRAPVSEEAPLGHQDVAWRADGKILLYVRNGRDGSRGAPEIWQYNPASRTSSELTGPGYTSPSFSPDGKWIAATRTTAFGTDVVILNAKTGAQVMSVTTDGTSFAPVWSPDGDSIAYLSITYQIVDLRLAPLEGTVGAWTLGDTINLTQSSGLDGASRPDWYVPPSDLPAPTATAGAGSSPSAGASTP